MYLLFEGWCVTNVWIFGQHFITKYQHKNSLHIYKAKIKIDYEPIPFDGFDEIQIHMSMNLRYKQVQSSDD